MVNLRSFISKTAIELQLEKNELPKGATTYTFNSIASNHTLEAKFEPNNYIINVKTSLGGSISPKSAIVQHNSSQTFTIIPEPGYHLSELIIDGEIQFVGNFNYAIPNIFIFMGNNFFETLYVQVQMFIHFKLAKNIYIYLPQWPNQNPKEHKRKNDIKNLDSLIKIIDLPIPNNYESWGSGGAVDCLEHFLKEHSDEAAMTLLGQDHWIIEPNRLMKHWNNFILNEADVMNYYFHFSGQIKTANDLMFLSPNCIKKFLTEKNWENRDARHQEALMSDIFASEKYKVIHFNTPETLISNYGYSSILGRAHVHFENEKKHYLKLWQDKYNTLLDVDFKELANEDVKKANPSTLNSPYPLAKDFNDNTAN